jgi:uncharacterized SAM-binding protein YcdF (DUF218 family)
VILLARRIVALVATVAILALVVIAVDIARFGHTDPGERAEVAVVLGAAVLWNRPSPVLVERLRHALELYQEGRVAKILVTGGRSPEDQISEAEAGRRWLMAEGVPEADILMEDASRTTYENLAMSVPVLEAAGFGSVLIVSDPIHMRRAMALAARQGLTASPSPTLTSRFVSLDTQVPFLLRETWFMALDLLLGWSEHGPAHLRTA